MAGDPAQPLAGQTWVNTDLKMLRVAIAGADGSVQIVSSPLVRDMTIVPMYQLKDYISLLLSLSIAFAAGFQTPVVVLLLGWVGIVDTTFLRKYRRHALLGAAIAAALLTPGDPASMIIMTIALQLLYELGILLLIIFPARRVSLGLTKSQRERTLAQEPSLKSETDDETP
jgi:Sec-independent protein secretion pathway component TatC